MPSIKDVLSRAGDGVLNALLDPSTQRTLATLHDKALSAESKVDLIIATNTPAGLLRNKATRARLVNLLTKPDAEILRAALGLPPTGPLYPALEKASIPKDSQREGSLFGFFGESPPPPEGAEEGPASQQAVVPQYALFAHQREAMLEVEAFFQGPRNRAFLHMPTGSGKTRTAMNLVSRYFTQSKPCIILWLAYSEELCEQAAEEFARAWSFHGDREIALHRFYGKHEWPEGLRDGLLIAGLDKLWNQVKVSEASLVNLAASVDLVVFDEAHLSKASTYELMVRMLVEKNERCALLGLSATPGRTWNDPSKDQELAELYYHQKVVLRVKGFDSPIDYLIKEGYLAQPDLHQLAISQGPLTPEEIAIAATGDEYAKSILRKLAESEIRNIIITKKVQDLVNQQHKRILVFATDVDHAEILAVLLHGQGLRAEAITTRTPTAVRRQRIADFKSEPGQTAHILCNYGVLTTGFDAPKTSAAIIARPTKSLILYSQMIGRVIRGPRVGGTEKAEIWTVVDSQLPGFGGLSDAFWNWEDVW